MFEIPDGPVELSDTDVTVTPVPVKTCVSGMLLGPFRVNQDRFTVLSEIAGASPIPNDSIGIIRTCFIRLLGFLVLFERALTRGGRIKGIAQERNRLSAFRYIRKKIAFIYLRTVAECGNASKGQSKKDKLNCFHRRYPHPKVEDNTVGGKVDMEPSSLLLFDASQFWRAGLGALG